MRFVRKEINASKYACKIAFAVCAALTLAFDLGYLIYLAVTAFAVLDGAAFFDATFRAVSYAAVALNGALAVGVAAYFGVSATLAAISNRNK